MPRNCYFYGSSKLVLLHGAARTGMSPGAVPKDVGGSERYPAQPACEELLFPSSNLPAFCTACSGAERYKGKNRHERSLVLEALTPIQRGLGAKDGALADHPTLTCLWDRPEVCNRNLLPDSGRKPGFRMAVVLGSDAVPSNLCAALWGEGQKEWVQQRRKMQ